MPLYLVAIHHPDGYDGTLEGEAMERDIDVLNEEMDAAGARIFAWRPLRGQRREVPAGAA